MIGRRRAGGRAEPPAPADRPSRVCNVEDFHDPGLVAVLREVFAHEVTARGPSWPAGREYRKHWEVAMAVLTLRLAGVLEPSAEVLGIGAGNEPTTFWLTRHVRRVFATDLYLSEGWEESAGGGMLLDPDRYWPAPWDRRRLVVQHMDGRDLLHPDGSFDAAFSSSSIEHFGGHEDVARAVDEAYRVLRPGGVLSLSTEIRLAGPGPGLPGTLLLSPDELDELVVRRRPWEVLGGSLDTTVTGRTAATFQDFDGAAADVRAHVAQHGEIFYHRLEWSRWPHVVLRHGGTGHEWTSVHLALRKP